MSFQISALPKSQFEHLFPLSTTGLASQGGIREVVTHKPGYPCRVSLTDAEVGEEVILVHYEHQTADTPFRASHAIYIRPNAPQANLQPNEVPDLLRSRTLSLRGFNSAGMLIAADLAEGAALEQALESMLTDPAVSYVHIHYAKPGCYAARADRA